MSFGKVYPAYIAKVEKKWRTKQELDTIIEWLTGYTQEWLSRVITTGIDFETFFHEAPKLNPLREKITGTICWYKIEDMENWLMKEIRYLDKLVDELAKGKNIEKVLIK